MVSFGFIFENLKAMDKNQKSFELEKSLRAYHSIHEVSPAPRYFHKLLLCGYAQNWFLCPFVQSISS